MNIHASVLALVAAAGLGPVLASGVAAQAGIDRIAFPDIVVQVDDLAALAQHPVDGRRRTAIVLGHRFPDDGGGGTFYWDATSGRPVDGGLVFASVRSNAPANGRWIRSFSGPVDIAWWGPFGDGRDESVLLNAAFAAAAGRGIVFREPLVYGFRAPLTIPAETRIANNHAAFLLLADPGGAAVGVQLGEQVRGDHLEVIAAAGVVLRRLLAVGDHNDIERLVVSARTHQANRQSNLDGALQIRSRHVRIGEIETSGFAYPVLMYQAEHCVIERLKIVDYITGFHARECRFLEILSAVITSPSPFATTLPGNNALLFSVCEDVVVSDTISHDAGEHPIRIGGDGDSSRFVFNNIQSIRPGQCGLKINPSQPHRVRDVQINGLTVIDAAATSTPGSNEDGLRIEESSHVTINGFQVQRRDRSVSAYDGIFITNSTYIVINGPKISDVAADGIHLQDIDGPVNEIFINNPTILIAGQHGIHVDSPTEVLRDITVMAAYIRGQGGWGMRVRANAATVGVNQPMVLDGWVKNDGLGGVSLTTTDPDIHNAVRVVN